MRLASLLALVLAAPVAAQQPVTIKEWTVPWAQTRPRDPAVAPDGRIWFVGQTGDYAAVLDPKTGEFKRYELEPGTGPHNLVVDAKGIVWYAGNRTGHIGRLDPATGAITKIPMPDPEATDPHTLVLDRNGDIWFTVQFGNFVGKLTVATRQVRLVKVPTPRARPYGIVIDRDNRPWFDLFGSNRIGTVDPVTFALKEYEIADPKARPRRIGVTSDGIVWWGDYTRGVTGRLDPRTGQITEYPNPAGPQSLPYAFTTDDRDRIWYVETGVQPNMLVGFDPRTKKVISRTPVPSGGGTVRYMVYDAKERVIWFGADANTVGRAVIPAVIGGTDVS